MKNLLLFIFLFICIINSAQIAITDQPILPYSSSGAVADVISESKGLLVPRLTTSAITSLENIATNGLIVFNVDDKCYYGFQNNLWVNLDGNCIEEEPPQAVFLEGDFIFTGFQSYGGNDENYPGRSQADKFSIVTLGTIPAGKIFYLTDSGWKADGTFRATEGLLQWTVTNQIPARTEIVFESPQNSSNTFEWTVTNGTLAVGAGDRSSGNSMALTNNGDNIIVFTATDDSDPYGTVDKFIVALKMENDWDTDSNTTSQSAIPPGLVNGETALAILANENNLKIKCTEIVYGLDDDQIRTIANDYTKWEAFNLDSNALPTNCNY